MNTLEVRLYMRRLFRGGMRPACWMCGVELTRKTATCDHLHPRSRGGSDDWQNLRPACQPCNNARGNRLLTWQEWAKALEWERPAHA